jgi:hypothetical protein
MKYMLNIRKKVIGKPLNKKPAMSLTPTDIYGLRRIRALKIIELEIEAED